MEIDVPKSFNGLVFTIKSVEKNKKISCEECKYGKHFHILCSYFVGNALTQKVIKRDGEEIMEGIGATVAVINVKNTTSNEKFYVKNKIASLIDTEGFVYNGEILCKYIVPIRHSMEFDDILPSSQSNIIVLFPELPDEVEPAKIIVHIGELDKLQIEFSINPIADEMLKTDRR
jgi:hypothetical protein